MMGVRSEQGHRRFFGRKFELIFVGPPANFIQGTRERRTQFLDLLPRHDKVEIVGEERLRDRDVRAIGDKQIP